MRASLLLIAAFACLAVSASALRVSVKVDEAAPLSFEVSSLDALKSELAAATSVPAAAQYLFDGEQVAEELRDGAALVLQTAKGDHALLRYNGALQRACCPLGSLYLQPGSVLPRGCSWAVNGYCSESEHSNNRVERKLAKEERRFQRDLRDEARDVQKDLRQHERKVAKEERRFQRDLRRNSNEFEDAKDINQHARKVEKEEYRFAKELLKEAHDVKKDALQHEQKKNEILRKEHRRYDSDDSDFEGRRHRRYDSDDSDFEGRRHRRYDSDDSDFDEYRFADRFGDRFADRFGDRFGDEYRFADRFGDEYRFGDRELAFSLRGRDGRDGRDGRNGTAGADGAAGPAGLDGAAGATGPVGATGAVGATGPAGVAGATGPSAATLDNVQELTTATQTVAAPSTLAALSELSPVFLGGAQAPSATISDYVTVVTPGTYDVSLVARLDLPAGITAPTDVQLQIRSADGSTIYATQALPVMGATTDYIAEVSYETPAAVPIGTTFRPYVLTGAGFAGSVVVDTFSAFNLNQLA